MPHKIVGEALKCTAYNTAGVHKVIVTDSQSRPLLRDITYTWSVSWNWSSTDLTQADL